jgi:transcriptional regulator with XRE-family HTH domain
VAVTSEKKVLRELGRAIKTARLEAGLTQEAAAEQIKIDYKRYQRIESGQTNITFKTAARIANGLRCTFTGSFVRIT